MTYIVFWISSNTNKNRGWTTPAVTARFKGFADQIAAQKFYDKMCGLVAAGKEYQSRQPSVVTRSWV